jgi:hypothetical protein
MVSICHAKAHCSTSSLERMFIDTRASPPAERGRCPHDGGCGRGGKVCLCRGWGRHVVVIALAAVVEGDIASVWSPWQSLVRVGTRLKYRARKGVQSGRIDTS